MFLHILPDVDHSRNFINFIYEKFNYSEHKFILVGKTKLQKVALPEKIDCIQLDHIKFISLSILLNKSQKIILHGLCSSRINKILFCQFWLLKKTSWCIWGIDLYAYQEKRIHYKAIIAELIRKIIISNLSGLITHVDGDVELARKWYGAKGKWYECFMYKSNCAPQLNSARQNSNKNLIKILIGNSADSSNNHIEIFNELSKLNTTQIEIIVPLSYGGTKNYVEEIIQKGQDIFPNFTTILDYTNFAEYEKILDAVDIAIYAHNRQQALGNITQLLGRGKKVYLKSNVSSWQLFERIGVICYDFLNQIDLTLIDHKISENNMKTISQYFNMENLFQQWKTIFED